MYVSCWDDIVSYCCFKDYKSSITVPCTSTQPFAKKNHFYIRHPNFCSKLLIILLKMLNIVKLSPSLFIYIYSSILKRAKVLSTSFPIFGNLIRLEVYHIDQMKTLLNFLEFSPNLEPLVINQVFYTSQILPHCLAVCLKSIEIRKFTGYLEMVKFVLKHGRVLQLVSIETFYTVEDPTDRRYKKKNMEAKWVEALRKSLMTILRQTPWASAGCVIKFLSS
ncbi:hypothetical protein MKX01_030012 [Papaver californicum]|nr:hypothetical protein MKX01_030012 [Papaver californicum]